MESKNLVIWNENAHLVRLFKDKYRIPSARAPFWRYDWPGAYFITICTSKRYPFLGHVIPHASGFEHYLSAIGEIVVEEWIKTPELRPEADLSLGEFVVMPDHFHGILIIGNGLRPQQEYAHNGLCEIQSNNIPAFVRGFKSAVTSKARKIEPSFGWQARYHDTIIRDAAHFDAVSQYIRSNPERFALKNR